MLPQTWENDQVDDIFYPYKGDGDPLDIVEIGSLPISTGSLLDVKLIGALCLIDQGEADWKILCINTNDKFAKKIQGPQDAMKHFPGKIEAIVEWFIRIKTFDGKKPNFIEGGVQDVSVAEQVISHCHKSWQQLKKEENDKFWLGE